MQYNDELGLSLGCVFNSYDPANHTVNLEGVNKPEQKDIISILQAFGGVRDGNNFRFEPTTPINTLVEAVILGRMVPDADFFSSFATPASVASQMWDAVHPEIRNDKSVRFLEPSAGTGMLLRHVAPSRHGIAQKRIYKRMVAIEKHPFNLIYLYHNFGVKDGIDIGAGDFMHHSFGDLFDLIVANPPVSTPDDKFAYVSHIWNMLENLDKGGQLVCLVPDDLLKNSSKRVISLRDHLLATGSIDPVIPGTMKGITTKNSFYVLSYYKITGRIHQQGNKHYREVLNVIRSRTGKTVAGIDTANAQPA